MPMTIEQIKEYCAKTKWFVGKSENFVCDHELSDWEVIELTYDISSKTLSLTATHSGDRLTIYCSQIS